MLYRSLACSIDVAAISAVSHLVPIRSPAGKRTQRDVEPDPRLLPLVKVSTLATPDVEHMRTRSTLLAIREFADQDRLDPIVELFEPNNRRELAAGYSDFGPRIVCALV